MSTELRRLPYGANYLDLDEMDELRGALDKKILFRYLAETPTAATRLEALACERFGTLKALALHNCTEALRVAILATRPCVGDVVYIPAVTFVAVAGAVLSCGLIPVLVDVDAEFCLDPAALPADAQRVIVAHMEGTVGACPVNVPYVIEDVAQSIGGRHQDGRYAGTHGYAGVFSFHHNKILTSGEGGLLITNDAERFELMRAYHDHGCFRVQGEYPRWCEDAFYGENLVTSEPIAAIQLQQFRHLDRILAGLERGYELLHNEIASYFQVNQRKTGDLKLSVRLEAESPKQAVRWQEALQRAGLPVWTLSRYFLPDHPVLKARQSIYADSFPWSLMRNERPLTRADETRERLQRIVCLPVSPELTEAEQRFEASRFRSALKSA